MLWGENRGKWKKPAVAGSQLYLALYTPTHFSAGVSMPPVFDHLQYAKMEGEGLINLTTWSVVHMTSQVLDTKTRRHIHIYISSYREVRETRQAPAKRQVLPLEQTESEAKPLKDCSTASVANRVSLLHRPLSSRRLRARAEQCR